MFLILENAVISRGYGDNPAIRFNDGEKGSLARFSVGKKMYHPRADDKTKWVNLQVKTDRPDLIEQIKRMQLKEGSWVNLKGEVKIEAWQDQTTKEEKEGYVMYLASVSYAGGGASKAKNSDNGSNVEETSEAKQTPKQSENWQGFEAFGNGAFFDT